MSTPSLMRRLGPEFKSADAEQGISDDELKEWLNDAALELGESAEDRFGPRYDRAQALAALHLLKMAERSRTDTRQGDGGLGLVGALASVSTTGGMNFTARDMTRDAPPPLRAKWGQTHYGEQLIGLFMETEEAHGSLTPDIIEPGF